MSCDEQAPNPHNDDTMLITWASLLITSHVYPCAVSSRRALRQTDPLVAYAAVDCNVTLSVGLDSFSTGLGASAATGAAALGKSSPHSGSRRALITSSKSQLLCCDLTRASCEVDLSHGTRVQCRSCFVSRGAHVCQWLQHTVEPETLCQPITSPYPCFMRVKRVLQSHPPG